jgi:hypothetical protein
MINRYSYTHNVSQFIVNKDYFLYNFLFLKFSFIHLRERFIEFQRLKIFDIILMFDIFDVK